MFFHMQNQIWKYSYIKPTLKKFPKLQVMTFFSTFFVFEIMVIFNVVDIREFLENIPPITRTVFIFFDSFLIVICLICKYVSSFSVITIYWAFTINWLWHGTFLLYLDTQKSSDEEGLSPFYRRENLDARWWGNLPSILWNQNSNLDLVQSHCLCSFHLYSIIEKWLSQIQAWTSDFLLNYISLNRFPTLTHIV